ncbi:hypothetical protein SAMN02799625_04869 [Methylobacterium sp. UNC300MFChir4.1]|uniref:hypothetical protein n=1 Tax=Methylobacterium sp. UNC300MFChir4.1 TaxID=1502747 RepID=UPI0008D82D4B|nr:hypothetical protein [Methylobacterium sp. UNC300MFChir4.1]SEP16964.1 hypothetical protein SAMN02799625_04869 [Methylobacterium sp. UNC300MFChir4.1]
MKAVRVAPGCRRFDCLPAAAARHVGAARSTEDGARGVVFAGPILINPFRASPDDALRRN